MVSKNTKFPRKLNLCVCFSPDDGEPPVVQSADGFLNFSTISRDHVGWYKCVADYEANNFASSGYYLNVRCECRQLIFLGRHIHTLRLTATGNTLSASGASFAKKHTHEPCIFYTQHTACSTRCLVIKISLTQSDLYD